MTLHTTFHGTREELDAYSKKMGAFVVTAGEQSPGTWVCLLVSNPPPPPSEEVALTLDRGSQAITALLRRRGDVWSVVEAVDEEGNPALLTFMEHVVLRQRAERGVDETGEDHD